MPIAPRYCFTSVVSTCRTRCSMLRASVHPRRLSANRIARRSSIEYRFVTHRFRMRAFTNVLKVGNLMPSEAAASVSVAFACRCIKISAPAWRGVTRSGSRFLLKSPSNRKTISNSVGLVSCWRVCVAVRIVPVIVPASSLIPPPATLRHPTRQ